MSHLLRAIRPIALDFLSTVVFVGVFSVTRNLAVSVAAAIGLGLGQMALQRLRREPIGLMQWAGLGLAVVFGGASLLAHDVRFVLFKPTLIYVAIGTVMLKRGWMDRYAPPIVHETMSTSAMTGWGYAWSALMFATGAVNLALAIHGDLKLWTAFISVAPLSGKLALFAAQYLSVRTHVKRKLRGTPAMVLPLAA